MGLFKGLSKLNNRNIVIPVSMFYAFVGLFYIFEGTDLDTARYSEGFIAAVKQDFGFIEYFNTLETANRVDFYTAFISWFCSRFISNPHIFIAILSGVMGLIFGRNITYIMSNTALNKYTKLLLVMLVFVPQAVYFPHRWWTAMQIFFMGALPYIIEGKRKYLFICFLSVLVHFSYLYMIFLMIGFVFLPKKSPLVYLVAFVISGLLSSFDFTSLTPYIENYIPGLKAERTIMYLNWANEETNFLSKSSTFFFRISSVILMITIYLKTEWSKEHQLRKIFIFTLLFASFAQIISLSPVGFRFKDFASLIITVFWIFYFSKNRHPICMNVIKYCIPVFVYYIIYQIRGILDCIGIQALLFGNFVDFFLIEESTTVLGYLKQLL